MPDRAAPFCELQIYTLKCFVKPKGLGNSINAGGTKIRPRLIRYAFTGKLIEPKMRKTGVKKSTIHISALEQSVSRD